MNMGGRSETTSECKSVTNSTRNSISQDDKGSELKGRKQAGRPASGDKKNENAEPSKLTYTSEEDIYYEPGGKRKKTWEKFVEFQKPFYVKNDMGCLYY